MVARFSFRFCCANAFSAAGEARSRRLFLWFAPLAFVLLLFRLVPFFLRSPALIHIHASVIVCRLAAGGHYYTSCARSRHREPRPPPPPATSFSSRFLSLSHARTLRTFAFSAFAFSGIAVRKFIYSCTRERPITDQRYDTLEILFDLQQHARVRYKDGICKNYVKAGKSA